MDNYNDYTREELLVIVRQKDIQINELIYEYKHQTNLFVFTGLTIAVTTLITYLWNKL